MSALDPGLSRDFTVTVEIPPDVTVGSSDTATIMLTSQGDPTQQASAGVTTSAASTVILDPIAAELSGFPGATVSYTLLLSNTGDVTDTFTLSAGEPMWMVTMSITETTLAPGEVAELVVEVAIPPDAPDGAMDVAIITAASLGDPLASASSTLTTTAIWWKNYLSLITSN